MERNFDLVELGMKPEPPVVRDSFENQVLLLVCQRSVLQKVATKGVIPDCYLFVKDGGNKKKSCKKKTSREDGSLPH